MWNIEKLNEILVNIVVLVLLLILVLKVNSELLLLVTSILLLVTIAKSYWALKQSGHTLYIISPSINTKWGVAWIGIGLIYLIPEAFNAFHRVVNLKYLLRGTTETLIGITFLIRIIDKNRITTKGLVNSNKLYQWNKIISWKWRFEETNSLVILTPKKSKRKPVAEVSLDVPIEKVEQVNNILYQQIPEKFKKADT